MINSIEIYAGNILDSKTLDIENAIIKKWLDTLDVLEETKETYLSHLLDYFQWLKENNIVNATMDDILKYKKYLISKYSNNTVCLKLSSVKSFYRFIDKEKIAEDITKYIKNPKIAKGFKRDIFTLEQIKRILNTIDTSTLLGLRDYALLNLLLRTGLRGCEIHRANIEDIRNKDGEMVLYVQGKGRTDKDEFVVLTSTMLNILNEYLRVREQKQHITDTSPLFISMSDRNFGERLSLYSIRWLVKSILREAGIDSKRLTTHSTRHTAITLSLLSGADLLDVKEMARHENINTTLLYVHNVNRISNAPEKKLEEVYAKNLS